MAPTVTSHSQSRHLGGKSQSTKFFMRRSMGNGCSLDK
jgi:hypothetical protein